MIIELNPAKWFGSKPAVVQPVTAAADKSLEVSKAAKAEESVMGAGAGVLPVAAAKKSGFLRFIDAIGHFFVKSAPVLEKIAVDLEPFLALTPFGAEYDLVVNAIVGVQKTAFASLSTGAQLSGEQRMALVLQAVNPGIAAILASKGITEPAAVQQAITEFTQNVYNLQTGPTTTVKPTPVVAPPAATI